MSPILLCAAPDCGRPASKATFCGTHYRRNLKYGSPYGGQTFRGMPQQFLATAVAYKGDDCLVWPYSRNAQGYGKIKAGGKNFVVSRLVCEMAYGPAPSPDHVAAHSCWNGHLGCVNPNHLRWATRAENSSDMVASGRSCRGSRNVQAKLSDENVRTIRSLHDTGATHKSLSLRFGVSSSVISRIVNHVSYRDVT